jgi:DNA polymerase-3 subunit beta
VIFAVTSDDPRYTLGGALWETQGDVLTMVSTDGHRLAMTRRTGQNVAKMDTPSIVVPRKALAELQKMSADHDGDTYFWMSGGSLFAQFGERELWTNLQEQRFPDYHRVLPQGNDKIVEISTSSFREAIERVAVLSLEHTHLIKFELTTDLLRLSAVHQQLGEAQEEIAVEYSGEPLAIGFNAQYLLDFLAVAGTERVRVSLGKEMTQGLFEPVRPQGDEREDKYVVMPMALT